jgi:hypothetical protein
MKLRFLGQTCSQFYQYSTVVSENIACYRYRGQTYSRCVPEAAYRQSRSPESLISVVVYKYRGVSYVVERHQFDTNQNRRLVCH